MRHLPVGQRPDAVGPIEADIVDGTGSQSGLSGALQTLVADPRRLGSVRLWQALSGEERREAARAYLSSTDADRERLNRVVARAQNFRPQTVRKWPEDKICSAMRFVPLRDSDLASELLRSHHVPGQAAMVAGFLDALGVPHQEGAVDSLEIIDADAKTVGRAIRGLVQEYGPRPVAVYLLALHLFGAPIGEAGRSSLLELLEAPPGEGDPDAQVSGQAATLTTEDPADDSEVQQRDPTRQPTFSTLDRLLILAAVDSAQGIHGALSADELDDAVDELVELNSQRHKSYFHAGFRDVVFDKPVGRELPAENQSRLRWYWTGAVQGWARREQWDRIVREHRENPVVRALGSGTDAASEAAVEHVVGALRREGQAAEIARFVRVPAILRQPALFRLLLDAGTELLSKGDAGSALPILELLMTTRAELERIGVPPTERLVLDAHRRMAHCLRHLRQHARARGLLADLLKHDPDPNIHAMVHADLGLIAGGFDAMEDVILPIRRDELDGVVERLARGIEHFRESVAIETAYSAHGHYCLGVLALGRAVADHTYEDAEHHLEAARVHFSEASDAYAGNLVSHASLYFGIAKAQQLSSEKLAHAADVIADSLRSGARMPGYLIAPTVEALGLADEKRDLRRVAEAIIETAGDQALDELAKCGPALDHCPPLADVLCERAGMDNRTAVKRAADLRAALRGLLGQGKLQAAGEVLDGLERLARRDVAVPEFLALLGERTRYDPVWDLEDATIACARCHEDRGEFLEAARILHGLFYRLASPEREAGLGDAAGVLKRIRGYGIDPSYYSDMTNRYDALSAQDMPEEALVEQDAMAAVRVLVVGGAELQARAEDRVHSTLRQSHPHIRVRWIQTGWSPNWHRRFAEIEREMERHDALVILRFMRTHLGREIRRTWAGPWRSCWGSGPGAIVEAVSRAATAAR